MNNLENVEYSIIKAELISNLIFRNNSLLNDILEEINDLKLDNILYSVHNSKKDQFFTVNLSLNASTSSKININFVKGSNYNQQIEINTLDIKHLPVLEIIVNNLKRLI